MIGVSSSPMTESACWSACGVNSGMNGLWKTFLTFQSGCYCKTGPTNGTIGTFAGQNLNLVGNCATYATICKSAA